MTGLPDFTVRRDELRELSRSRTEAGLSPFPSLREVREYAQKYGVREIDAHTYFMLQGKRILQIREGHEQTIISQGTDLEESTSFSN